MNQSYEQLMHQIIRRENLKHFHTIFDDELEKQEVVNNHAFEQIINILKQRFSVLYRIVGDVNFNKLVHEYFKYNPLQSASMEEYGKTFPHFLQTMDEIEAFPYLYLIAQLDWFWAMRTGDNQIETFPKGTLDSWVSIYKNLPEVEISINLKEKEKVAIFKEGQEYSIKVIG